MPVQEIHTFLDWHVRKLLLLFIKKDLLLRILNLIPSHSVIESGIQILIDNIFLRSFNRLENYCVLSNDVQLNLSRS